MKTNKKIIWLVCIVSAFAVLLTAYIMPFLEKALVSLKIEENAMLRAFSIEFIIRPVIASVISIFMFYLGLIFLRRLGIYTESSTLRWYEFWELDKKGTIYMKRYSKFLIMLFLIACNKTNPKAQSTTPAETPLPHSSVSTTPTSRQTAKPNQTVYISTSTPLPTQTPDEILNGVVQRQCLDIDTDIVSIQNITETGTVVLRDTASRSIYILDLETNTRYTLPLKKQHNLFIPPMHISPNGNYLAYIEYIENDSGGDHIIWVIDSEGVVLVNQSINFNILFREWRWLDNERIEFNVQSLTTKDGTVVIYYPFKDEWQYLSNTLPNFFQNFDFVLFPTNWLVNYSANLEQVIYLGQDDVNPILWDTSLDKVIWHISVPNASTRIPRWSNAGDKVAIPYEGSLYIIDIDGKITKAPDLGQNFEVMRIAWSHDGNYIVLLVRVRDNQSEIEYYIMLYDVQNNQVIDYCIESGNLLRVEPPVWSNNSQFFFSDLIVNDEKFQTSPILVDVKKNSVYLLSDGLIPLAWMNSKSK